MANVESLIKGDGPFVAMCRCQGSSVVISRDGLSRCPREVESERIKSFSPSQKASLDTSGATVMETLTFLG